MKRYTDLTNDEELVEKILGNKGGDVEQEQEDKES